MQFLILTEVIQGRGLGHYSRCSSFAFAAHSLAHSVKFVLRGERDRIASLQKQNPHVSADEWLARSFTFYEKRWDAILIDSYEAPLAFFDNAHEFADHVLVLDDEGKRTYPPGTAVINAAPGSQLAASCVDCIAMLGPQYVFVRPEFWNISRIPNSNLQLLISLGGEPDVHLLEALVVSKPTTLSSWTVHVLAGMKEDEVRQRLGNRAVVHGMLSAAEVRDLFCASHLAIAAAGQSLIELARCGVPFVTGMTAANQEANARGWAQLAELPFVGWYRPDSMSAVWDQVHSLLAPEILQSKSKQLQRIVDGLGPERVLRYLNGE